MKISNFKFKILNSGFTIIESLVFLFIFSVITVTFYSAWSLGMKHIIESKNRMGATALASEKMEIIRNLQYDNIGVQSGIPNGNILADEDVTENGKSYHVKTFIQFIDDAFDGTYPDDSVPNDYKRAKVTVTWGGIGEVSLVSRFVPPGLEVDAGKGVLSINVMNSQGGVPQSTVHIVNNDISPAVDITLNTDNSGNLMFPGAEASTQKYQITVSKNGYETVATVDPLTIPDYNPVDTNASVSLGSINTKTIFQNKVSNLDILSIDMNDAPIPNAQFDIKGGRILGTKKISPFDNVYNLDEISVATNASGEKEYNLISPGQYAIYNIGSVSGYTFISTDPISPFSLIPDETKTVKIKFADDNADSLLVSVIRSDDSSPINGAQVRLSNGTGYDSTETTLEDGLSFFQAAAGAYNLEVSASGFQSYSSSISINKFISQQVILTPE
ncbi:MAG: hypothetical protein A3E91_02155 [Candidatus Moranbacteria bacterium RIFCSPHIGHO2_12_FULL_40_10]|nr:MAG: hypothetical protein A3E91_02155 [Candidatus Moranbacteria bacterium RIFCSPHIGHO2_12_FULL_40_10]